MTIDNYSENNKSDFERIWVDWLLNTMGIEPQQEDLEDVQNPIKNYIKQGGMVFYANKGKSCLGVVAVKRLNELEYEFCKLVVTKEARGMGLGKMLVQKCLDYVIAVGGTALYLQSFHKLEIAVKMYQKMGFLDCPAPKGMLVVNRTEIIMKKEL